MVHNYATGVHLIKESAKNKLIIFKIIIIKKALLKSANVKEIDNLIIIFVKAMDMIFLCALTIEIDSQESSNATGDQEKKKHASR